jgi:hypothetical protein
MDTDDLRSYLIDFFRTNMNSIDNTESFLGKVELFTNLYGIMVQHFNFISSDTFAIFDVRKRFLESCYEKALEVKGAIHSRIDINIDINQPITRNEYYPIYDACLNIINEFEERYKESLEEENTIVDWRTIYFVSQSD